ncbi:MAG: hypothetical protein IT435_08005 [Phycisphaerales bacterium]|nr:hypothetical protein [Phycisphaerales bacterium]
MAIPQSIVPLSPDPGPAPARLGILTRWLRNAMVVGLIISAAIHLSGIGIAGGIGIGGFGSGGVGAGGSAPPPVDFAVVPEVELTALAGTSILDSVPTPDVGTLDPDQARMDAMPSPGIGDPNAGLGDSASGELTIGGGSALSDGDGLGIGTGAGAGGGGASFFGVEAAGSRFAYIIDMSASMNWDGKIDVLRSELARSIEAMTEQNEFVVVLFSDMANIMGDRAQWVSASDAGKKWARRTIAALRPDGGTNPVPGFIAALQTRPRPDAIYFMTDGEFADPDGVAAEVNALNNQLKIPVHCLCFVTPASEPVMRKIANASGGSYTFIPKK